MIQTNNGTVYYVCDQSVLGDKPPGSNIPVDNSQNDNNPSAFLTQDEGECVHVHKCVCVCVCVCVCTV